MADLHPVLATAVHRYLYDAVHHARVETAAQILSADLHDRTGFWANPEDMSLARLAAGVALVLAEQTVGPVDHAPFVVDFGATHSDHGSGA